MKTQSSEIFLILIVLSALCLGIQCINRKCDPNRAVIQGMQSSEDQSVSEPQCPSENSLCSEETSYCICSPATYFGSECQFPSYLLTSDSQQFTVQSTISDPKTTFFTIQPTLNSYVYYQFTLCNKQAEPNNQEILNLWTDDGNLIEPNTSNALGNDKYLSITEGCVTLMTPFFYFTNQASGQKQLLILGVRLKGEGSVNISLNVEEAELFGFDVLFRIIIILLSGIGALSLAGVVYCVYKFRRRGRTQNPQEEKFDISFFEEYMPSHKVNLSTIAEEVCSVCLAEYKEEEEVRETICRHLFHKTCLDEWCVTNLSCPICRTSFEKANLIHMQYVNSRSESENSKSDPKERQLRESQLTDLSGQIDESLQEEFQYEENLRKPMID